VALQPGIWTPRKLALPHVDSFSGLQTQERRTVILSPSLWLSAMTAPRHSERPSGFPQGCDKTRT
jgi:hypothetical protein